jgi:hypothetical protein
LAKINNEAPRVFLVGDNPFHGISHLSQERARSRSGTGDSPLDKSDVVLSSLRSGANGFMFSVSDTTLSILRVLRERKSVDGLKLYAIVPYAFEYVRVATQTGTPGLAKKVLKQIAVSGNVKAFLKGSKAVFKMDPSGLLDTYLSYEISRIKSAVGSKKNLASVLLHEVVTDMGLALDMEWLFSSYIASLSKIGIVPGFHTRNFPYLVKKFNQWNMDADHIIITTPFNKAGFQMNPSREECEKTLANLTSPIVLAISILAGGYFQPSAAVDYIAGLDNLKGVVAGVSTEQQARETFELFTERLREGC